MAVSNIIGLGAPGEWTRTGGRRPAVLLQDGAYAGTCRSYSQRHDRPSRPSLRRYRFVSTPDNRLGQDSTCLVFQLRAVDPRSYRSHRHCRKCHSR